MTSAEMMYGTIFKFSGSFFLQHPQKPLDMSSFVDRITARIANLAYNSPAPSQMPIYVPKLLQICSQVFGHYLVNLKHSSHPIEDLSRSSRDSQNVLQ